LLTRLTSSRSRIPFIRIPMKQNLNRQSPQQSNEDVPLQKRLMALTMAAACLRAILHLATISCLLPHLHHFQRSPKVLFFGSGYSSWPFVTSTEPGFNKFFLCEVNLVNTNLALSRSRSSVALWSKRGLTTPLIPRHDHQSEITIFMDINPNPGPNSVQDNLNPSRSAATHLHVTSQGGQSFSY